MSKKKHRETLPFGDWHVIGGASGMLLRVISDASVRRTGKGGYVFADERGAVVADVPPGTAVVIERVRRGTPSEPADATSDGILSSSWGKTPRWLFIDETGSGDSPAPDSPPAS